MSSNQVWRTSIWSSAAFLSVSVACTPVVPRESSLATVLVCSAGLPLRSELEWTIGGGNRYRLWQERITASQIPWDLWPARPRGGIRYENENAKNIPLDDLACWQFRVEVPSDPDPLDADTIGVEIQLWRVRDDGEVSLGGCNFSFTERGFKAPFYVNTFVLDPAFGLEPPAGFSPQFAEQLAERERYLRKRAAESVANGEPDSYLWERWLEPPVDGSGQGENDAD